jgi:hypothetical protein
MKELENPSSIQVLLLIKECGLTASSIDQGLTSLRKSHFGVKGLYYQAFFLLSIGIERLLKLIIVVKSLIEKDEFPKNDELKNYGHNIIDMFYHITQELCPNDNFINSNDLFVPILRFLSDYAQGSRYYNLDTLSGRTTSAGDPLHNWYEIQQLIKVKHCKFKDFSPYEKELIKNIANHSSFHYTAENDSPINNAYKYFEEGKYLNKIQGFSVWYFYQIIDYLVKILSDEADKKSMLPYYLEFFPLFDNPYMTKEQILKKKKWDHLTNP